jgi:hypothetical protein
MQTIDSSPEAPHYRVHRKIISFISGSSCRRLPHPQTSRFHQLEALALEALCKRFVLTRYSRRTCPIVSTYTSITLTGSFRIRLFVHPLDVPDDQIPDLLRYLTRILLQLCSHSVPVERRSMKRPPTVVVSDVADESIQSIVALKR